ncbi:hypothetical protein BGX34_004901 [Mortierella sp. NVP85]|nr:hypothetical protein BGX34_004901 [Mortierella sp. NVP85]
MSPNSTTDPTEDNTGEVDATAARDHLILGILVGICTLVLGVGVAAACWRFRKSRLKLLRQLDSRDHDNILHEKTLLLYACCCLGAGTMRPYGRGGGISDDGVPTDVDTQGPRVITVEEPESHEGSLMTGNRSNAIFARRWRWGQDRIVVPEIEPPPMYHQGPELPTYGSDAIPLEPLNPVAADTIEVTPTPDASAPGSDEGGTLVSVPQ